MMSNTRAAAVFIFVKCTRDRRVASRPARERGTAKIRRAYMPASRREVRRIRREARVARDVHSLVPKANSPDPHPPHHSPHTHTLHPKRKHTQAHDTKTTTKKQITNKPTQRRQPAAQFFVLRFVCLLLLLLLSLLVMLHIIAHAVRCTSSGTLALAALSGEMLLCRTQTHRHTDIQHTWTPLSPALAL